MRTIFALFIRIPFFPQSRADVDGVCGVIHAAAVDLACDDGVRPAQRLEVEQLTI